MPRRVLQCAALLLAVSGARTQTAAGAPPTLESLQAALNALQSQLPPQCTGSSFVQRTASGAWACTTPISGSGGFCRASAGGEVTCDVATQTPPNCLPPGGAHLAFDGAASRWFCVCADGFSGVSCDVGAALLSGAARTNCSVPQCSLTGSTSLYQYINATWSCACLAGWAGVDCSQVVQSPPPSSPPPLAPVASPPPSSPVGTQAGACLFKSGSGVPADSTYASLGSSQGASGVVSPAFVDDAGRCACPVGWELYSSSGQSGPGYTVTGYTCQVVALAPSLALPPPPAPPPRLAGAPPIGTLWGTCTYKTGTAVPGDSMFASLGSAEGALNVSPPAFVDGDGLCACPTGWVLYYSAGQAGPGYMVAGYNCKILS